MCDAAKREWASRPIVMWSKGESLLHTLSGTVLNLPTLGGLECWMRHYSHRLQLVSLYCFPRDSWLPPLECNQIWRVWLVRIGRVIVALQPSCISEVENLRHSIWENGYNLSTNLYNTHCVFLNRIYILQKQVKKRKELSKAIWSR